MMNRIRVHTDDGSALNLEMIPGDSPLLETARGAATIAREFFPGGIISGTRDGVIILIPTTRITSIEVLD